MNSKTTPESDLSRKEQRKVLLHTEKVLLHTEKCNENMFQTRESNIQAAPLEAATIEKK